MRNKRQFIISGAHRRLSRIWQFFFAGWGLLMVAVLVAGSLFTKQLLWTPISAINMKEIANNQFKMENAAFAGTDKAGLPFSIRVAAARQEYDNPDMVFVQKVSGTITRMTEGQLITDKIVANSGQYSRKARTMTLRGNVRVDSSNGDRILTQELVVQL
ncbi:MAG: LPS export ABC transporter periplasmic protein LptC [Rickettsiales bacterium]|jgi:hypothetical protein|nr:LPS export ABC transporter periplasmic protein LptC [Rickettsiales bacterium]